MIEGLVATVTINPPSDEVTPHLASATVVDTDRAPPRLRLGHGSLGTTLDKEEGAQWARPPLVVRAGD
jgi:hypothetical protein